jgi:hypothetical protein
MDHDQDEEDDANDNPDVRKNMRITDNLRDRDDEYEDSDHGNDDSFSMPTFARIPESGKSDEIKKWANQVRQL